MQKNVFLTAVMLLLVICFTGTAVYASAVSSDKIVPGSDAPDFALKDVNSGETVKLSDFRDKKIVIVHFWKSQ